MNLELFPENHKSEGDMVARVDFAQLVKDVDLLRVTGMPGGAAIDKILTDIQGVSEAGLLKLRNKIIDALLERSIERLKASNPDKVSHQKRLDDWKKRQANDRD